jgi:hypothetical protein
MIEQIAGYFGLAQPSPAATVETFPRWCPGCSRDVDGVCSYFQCAVGPNGLDAQLRLSAATGDAVQMSKATAEWIISQALWRMYEHGKHSRAASAQCEVQHVTNLINGIVTLNEPQANESAQAGFFAGAKWACSVSRPNCGPIETKDNRGGLGIGRAPWPEGFPND